MIATVLLAVLFTALAILDWVYRSRALRVGAVTIAILALIFTQSSARHAGRVAWTTAPEERVAYLRGQALNAYESGVLTMEREVIRDKHLRQRERLLAYTVLVWFALSPALRRRDKRAARAIPDEPPNVSTDQV